MTPSPNTDWVLLLNAGSTTLKLAGWTLQGAVLWEQRLEGGAEQLAAALPPVLAALPHSPVAVLQRIVHAGAVQEQPALLDTATRARIAHWAPLAPLHNPLALTLADVVHACWPAAPQWAVFDSGLYADLPAMAAHYALPDTLSPRWPLRRYGFHGLAHRSQWRQMQPADGRAGPRRLITLQLGGGCSLSAWKDDRVIDTSMGFTPLEGLVMATRSGTLDPGILLHLLQQEGMRVEALQALLLQHSGLAGMAPGAGDMRALLADASPAAQQALAHYVWQIRKAIGAAVAVLGGLDALSIGGGVGEHQSEVRARILEDMTVFGIALDATRNARAQGRCALEVPGSAVSLTLTPVNEMAEMFRQFADMRGCASPTTSQENSHHDSQQLWQRGLGVIQHRDDTRERVSALVDYLDTTGQCPAQQAWRLFAAADRLCSMGLWLTAHMTYARQVWLDGRAMTAQDFKDVPEGHTGGALNMVPAYVGYLLANALSGRTRAWMMGQGHCVAAIDAVNLLTRNLEPEQQERYPLSDEGLSRLCQDFYSYAITPEGRPAAPLGSHVNVHTAGGISEGGYLGFAGLQYVHMPLPGQELVSFLSDGAFEEQRGSDWAARWWRGEDTGLVMPVMIANGRRIDQRTTMSQSGGVHWFREHLQLNGFEPVDIDGRDPAAFAWAILHMGERLQQQHEAIRAGRATYPVRLPYAIAETVKGFGFPGAGTNAAHNLPLPGSGAHDLRTRELFNEGCALLHVPVDELQDAIATLQTHAAQGRVLERDHCLRRLVVPQPVLPAPRELSAEQPIAPMAAVDEWVCELALANPGMRIRVGNPDEMRSNRMNKTLDLLQHRVTSPEKGVAESLQGSVITALNEEAVVSAALANKQGLNLAVSYEAFAVKMLGAMRQEVIFARHALEAGREVPWVSVPVLVSSHTWENGKNEQSHQDPTLCEAWLGEMADVAPVYFPFDAASAVAVMQALMSSRGRVATVVAAKSVTPQHCSAAQAAQAVRDGALLLRHAEHADLQLLALGACQLQAALDAAQTLQSQGLRCSVVALVEPGRFRLPRDAREADYVHADADIAAIIPPVRKRLFVCHTRAEVMTGVLRRLDTGARDSVFLGYRNRGGTLDVAGMQQANGQSAAQIVAAALALLEVR